MVSAHSSGAGWLLERIAGNAADPGTSSLAQLLEENVAARPKINA